MKSPLRRVSESGKRKIENIIKRWRRENKRYGKPYYGGWST